MKRIFLVLMAFAIVLSLYFSGAEPEPAVAVAVAPRLAPSLPLTPAPVAAETPALAPPAPGADVRPWLSTLSKLNGAPSYRAFVYDAGKRQAPGALHYNEVVISICTNAQVVKNDEAQMGSSQREAMAKLRSRCDLSLSEIVTEFSVMPGKSKNADPSSKHLIAAGSAFDQAKNDDEEQRAVRNVLATQDPTVMLRLAASPTSPAGTRPFQGRDHAVGPQSNFSYAMQLAQCELGLECGPDSPWTLLLCIHNNWCAASYRDALQIGLASGSPSRFSQVEALATELARELRNQNAAAFLRKK